jgi:hypothetical protein
MLERIEGFGRRLLLIAGAALTVATLASCGGAGAGAGGSGATSGSGTVADISLSIDKPALPAPDGSTTATIVAQVKDAASNVLRGQQVAFSTTDRGVSLAPIGTSSVTDASGTMQMQIVLGSTAEARARRTVTVTATSGGQSRSTTLQVEGSTLTIDGDNSIAVGGRSTYTVTALDASKKPVAGLAVAFRFTGGTPASSTVSTGSNGQASLEVTAVTPGNATIEASASGVDTVSRTVTVLGNDAPFRFVSPNDGVEVDVNTNQTMVVQLRENGAPVVGRTITLATTRGLLNGGSTVSQITNANGEVSITARSPSAGQATINATYFVSGQPTTISTRVNYVSRTPAKVSLSPDPTSIGANAGSSTSSTSRLVATVRDATDNPVKGALVTFSAQDPSNGSIQPSSAVTDASGQAIASFIAGPTSTGPDAVRVTATAFNGQGVAVASDTRNMTVSAVALFIELGTGNTIEAISATDYSMPWSAIVTDANRNPVVGAPVTVSLTAINFFKGIWVYTGGAWRPRSFDNITAPPLTCVSEDLNGNNLLDTSEDTDGDGRLDPGSPAAARVVSTDSKTGSDGRATLSIVYPKSFGEWVEVTMRVTIGTPGTESSIYRTFVLPVLAGDVTTETSAPPNVNARTPNNVTPAGALVGPYGYVQDCTSPN